MTDRVRALLGGAGLRPLIDRVEQRMRLGRPLSGAVTLAGLGPEQQGAIAALLGRPVGRGATASVRLEDVDLLVRSSGAAASLADAVRALRGPVPVAADEAAIAQARWDAAFAPLEAYVVTRPALAALPRALRRTGALKSVTRGPEEAGGVLADLVTVLRELPTRGETLAAFSARVLHRAHALDVGILRALVETALAELAGPDAAERDDPETPREDRLAGRWAAVGIVSDTLASSALVHGLRFAPAEPVGAALNALTNTGQPVLVTLRMLLAGACPVPSEVFVCENPAVLIAAADRFGTACAPMVCVRGQPSVATQRLLRLLADSGAVLRYHGDFDWGGIRIANRLIERFGAVPWRFGVPDLEATDVPGEALAGDPVEALWEPGLATAILARGSRLEEEQVLSTLLPDLDRP